jgi:prophage maintenance system killer protein
MNTEPWSHLISTEVILKIHSECIERFGGDSTSAARDGCIERSTGAAWSAELYLENPDAVFGLCFAGCLLFYLMKNNCFVDGNKRVGWAACMEVLRVLGLTITATQEEVESFCLAILDKDSTIARNAVDVSAWLAPRLVAL